MKTFFPVTDEEAARICAAPEPNLLDRARNRVNRDNPTPAQAARHGEDNPCIIRGTE
jgi:hypothetical protein